MFYDLFETCGENIVILVLVYLQGGLVCVGPVQGAENAYGNTRDSRGPTPL